MIKTLLALSLLMPNLSQAQDLVLQTRLEQSTLSALVDKTRVLLNNSEIGDHMTGVVGLSDDITFNLNELVKSADYAKFKDLFSGIFKMDLNNAVLRIRIPKIGYEIKKLDAKPLSLAVQDPILNLGVTSYIHELGISLTDGIDLDLMIVNPKTNKPESYLTAHLIPTTINFPANIEPLSLNVQFEAKRDENFNYSLKSYDLTSIPDFVNRHLNDLLIIDQNNQHISAQSISVNPVTVRLSSLTRTVSFDSFKPILQKNFDKIISSIISSLGRSLQNSIGPKILTKVFSSKTRSDLIVKNEHLYTRFITSNFSQPTKDQLYLGVTGELCTAELYQQYHEQCSQQVNFPASARSISDGDRSNAMSEITENLARGNSDLILSLSEEYMNRLLAITVQANLWNESLGKQHLAIGPKGAFLIFNQRTQTPELFLDVLYTGEGKGIEGILITERHPLRFPLRISTSMQFTNQDGIPHLIIKTEKVLSDKNEIMNGIPEYDLSSHLIIGLKKTIAKKVLEMSAQINGQTAIDLELPVLKNIDLEKTWHEASPFGRLNLFFKL